ncbi:SET domain-containing protein-lysine N-methyltransferase [Flavobacterium sp. LMO8]|nr:SET domain-containing protein-lysine N-methyltransferase [Flavobacterium sp. LMO8]
MKKSTNSIDAPESDYLYIQDSQISNAGKGLYTAIDIYPNEIISLFKGEILTEKEAQKRVSENNDRYFINRLDGSILDSMNVECFAKYANDAEAFTKLEFKNNCKIALDEYENICIIATKKIKSGQEIFCSYGKKYWKKHG